MHTERGGGVRESNAQRKRYIHTERCIQMEKVSGRRGGMFRERGGGVEVSIMKHDFHNVPLSICPRSGAGPRRYVPNSQRLRRLVQVSLLQQACHWLLQQGHPVKSLLEPALRPIRDRIQRTQGDPVGERAGCFQHQLQSNRSEATQHRRARCV